MLDAKSLGEANHVELLSIVRAHNDTLVITHSTTKNKYS